MGGLIELPEFYALSCSCRKFRLTFGRVCDYFDALWVILPMLYDDVVNVGSGDGDSDSDATMYFH